MAISTEIVGKTFGPFVRDCTFKDLEICALGCGAGWDGTVDTYDCCAPSCGRRARARRGSAWSTPTPPSPSRS